jgi:hypothetical protein
MNPSDPSGISRKPYLVAWLKRTRRELSLSGRLSEIGLILSRKLGGDAGEWRERLRKILGGEEEPGLELLTEIDSILARPSKAVPDTGREADLFE